MILLQQPIYTIIYMFHSGDVISYLEMCQEEGVNLQRGMNFHLHGSISVILMSQRKNAPYSDRIEENGNILIYEGHDTSLGFSSRNPKTVDQPMYNPSGSLTQNGLFFKAAQEYKKNSSKYEIVRVYEKIHPGIWVFNGMFKLIDAWQEQRKNRSVFKFKMEISKNLEYAGKTTSEIEHNRLIPATVKLEVWQRDKGKCVVCGSNKNLHFDHIIPYSKGGSSLVADNIQLLCVKHNLEKRDKIE
jgi:hypothetical protein